LEAFEGNFGTWMYFSLTCGGLLVILKGLQAHFRLNALKIYPKLNS